MMSSKALVHYRKAELLLRRGDVRTALLQLKMAIASDPKLGISSHRAAEVEAELAKNPRDSPGWTGRYGYDHISAAHAQTHHWHIDSPATAYGTPPTS